MRWMNWSTVAGNVSSNAVGGAASTSIPKPRAAGGPTHGTCQHCTSNSSPSSRGTKPRSSMKKRDKENHELPSRRMVSMKKEKKKIRRAGSGRHSYTSLPSLILLAEPNANSANQEETAQIKSKRRKSRENSANQEKTVQTKSKQYKSNANGANQMQTMQIKRKQRKSNANSANSPRTRYRQHN
jgi:hypothetical protein